jgi:hypothetical protein
VSPSGLSRRKEALGAAAFAPVDEGSTGACDGGRRFASIADDVRPFLEHPQDAALLTRDNLAGLLRSGC